jgi:hypothetical protein
MNLTLIICCVSCIILGGTATAVWLIFREKDPVEQLKSKLRPDQHNVIASEYFRPKSNNLTGDCPVSVCNIKGPHSHTEALMRRVKEK